MAKELTFEQLMRDRSAIYPDKWTLCPLAVCMNGLRHEFLASATLSNDQDVGICGRNQLYLLDSFRDCRAYADDFTMISALTDLLLEVGVFHL
jgi:hypothetical protein